jgi:hypothetical protein
VCGQQTVFPSILEENDLAIASFAIEYVKKVFVGNVFLLYVLKQQCARFKVIVVKGQAGACADAAVSLAIVISAFV